MKLRNKNKITLFKKTLIETLVSLGYEKTKSPKINEKYKDSPWLYSPQIFASWELEGALRKFNFGEAYYYLDWLMTHVEYIGHFANTEPNHENHIDADIAHEMFWNTLTFGEEFRYGEDNSKYGIARIVDLKIARNNKFTLVENWQGAQGNGFEWDVVLCVNYIPLIAINIRPSTEGNEPMEEVLNETITEIQSDPQFSTYAQVVFACDGDSVYVGSPFSQKEEYGMVKSEHLFDMLAPEALIDVMRVKNKPDELEIQPKRVRGRVADPFLSDTTKEASFVKHLQNIVLTHFLPEQNLMQLLSPSAKTNPSKFFACLYSACIEYKVAIAGASSKGFSKLLDKAVEGTSVSESFTLGYEAINTQVSSWTKLVKMGMFSARPLIHEISRDSLLEPQSLRKLNEWKELYQEVVQIGLKEGIFER